MSEQTNPPARKKSRDPRYSYRARSHASAHAEMENAAPQVIPEHPLIPGGPARLISLQEELDDLVEHLRGVGSFAYDSEFIGEMSYHPKLCLIQVATPQRVTLIDTLAGLDVKGFWELIADGGVEKVVHSGQQDLEPVFRELDRCPANVFDTQVAAGFIGLAYPVGLSKLVRELTGVQLGKGLTFTHWDHRPLSAVQLRYAADDVRYLPAVREAIGRQLAELGHERWAKEECEAMCDPELYRTDPVADFRRIRGANGLPPKSLAVLRELAVWREVAAEKGDTPPRSYVRDEVMVDMARRPPKTLADLDKVKGLPRPVENEEGANIIAAVERGLGMPEADFPAVQQMEETPGERFGTDALWGAAQAWCAGQSIDTSLVASRQEIARLYRQYLERGEVVLEGRLARGWRDELLGKTLTELLAGRMGVEYRWEGGGLRSRGKGAGGS